MNKKQLESGKMLNNVIYYLKNIVNCESELYMGKYMGNALETDKALIFAYKKFVKEQLRLYEKQFEEL